MATTHAAADSSIDTETHRDLDPWPGESTRNSKEDALSDKEFERMVEATYRMDDDYFSLEARMILFAAGRLGMRSGEITHLREEWIDWRRNMIHIPRMERCDQGKHGGICGSCQQSAAQMADVNDEVSLEWAQSIMWRPKTESAAREIPIDATTRAAIALEDYFARFDRVECSQTTINRRVSRMAEMARGLDAETVYPHALRSTAASFFAARNVGVTTLKSYMGWADFSTAIRYIDDNGDRTAASIRNVGL